MTKTENILKAKARTRVGKGAARAERRAGNVPAVIYGGKKAPVSFAVNAIDLATELRKPGFRTRVYTIDIEGEVYHAICHDIQRDIILNHPIHLDFLRVNKNEVIRIEIPLVFLNEEDCPGIKKGGVANISIREIAVLCKPDAIPEHIDIDLSGLEIGDSLHLSSIKFPDGVKAEEEDEVTIVTIHSPAAEVPEEESAVETEAAANSATASPTSDEGK